MKLLVLFVGGIGLAATYLLCLLVSDNGIFAIGVTITTLGMYLLGYADGAANRNEHERTALRQ